ncbi:MAG TPA: phage terminase large subunit, partial [Thermomicrobiales bacterium]|nr:phage terminase large subunit [Thermomicrobiales bacterium]
QTLESLKPAALNTFIAGVMPSLHGVTYFGGNKVYPAEFRYPNGSVIHVSGLDKAEKVKSSEYDLIYVNEATETDEATWEMLKSRLRNGAMPYQQLVADCNPSGPKHWLKRRCESGRTRMIVSTHRDNPAYWDRRANDWTAKGRQYVQENLASLSGVQRKRLYQGIWAAVEGLVYAEFEPEMIRPQDVEGWRNALGVDVGSRNPTAILDIHAAGDGRTHVSHEIYRTGMSNSDILLAVRQRADILKPEAIFIDPSAKGLITDLVRLRYPAKPANNEVLYGIQVCHSALQAGFTVDPSCVNFIDEMGMYAYAENPRIETDKPVKDWDHTMDAWRYGTVGLLEPPRRGAKVWSF